jgi:hypothetical protein
MQAQGDGMKRILVFAIWMSATMTWAADKIQPMDVKLGLWEVTSSIKTSGQIPIPPDELAKLTPAQRAMAEKAMRAQSPEKNRTITRKECLTKEKLQEGAFGEERPSCKRTIETSTSSRLDLRLDCTQEGVTAKVNMQVVALDSENVKGETHMTLNGNQGAVSDSTFTAKWVGASCGSVH